MSVTRTVAFVGISFALVFAGGLYIGYAYKGKERDKHYGTILSTAETARKLAVDELRDFKSKGDKQGQTDQDKINTELQGKLKDEKDKYSTLIANYDNGSLRLRRKFTDQAQCGISSNKPDTGTSAPDVLPNTAAAGASNDGSQGIQLQSDDVKFLVRYAADAKEVEDKLSSCQATVENYLKIVNGKAQTDGK